MPRRNSGFTLIELLVVISIIALLVSILLPSLNAARKRARDVVCRTHLSGLIKSSVAYQTDYDEWFPGLNTTGVAMRKAMFGTGLTGEELRRRYTLPVQPHDWITPLLAQEMNFSGSNRADRFALATEKYHCPEQRPIESRLYPDSPPGSGILSPSSVKDAADFQWREWTALSYLQPVHFQYWGGKYIGKTLSRPSGVMSFQTIRALGAPGEWESVAPDYRSRVRDIGTPGNKVFAADGTRYVTMDGHLDHDVSPNPNLFGSFTSTGAFWRGSTTYGVREGSPRWHSGDIQEVGTAGGLVGKSPSNGRNMRYSYRHGGNSENQTNGSCKTNNGRINAAFFDGSVQQLTDRESRRPELWYPKGTRITKPGEGMWSV